VFDRREFPVDFRRSELVDFWACDATSLPFPDETFSLSVGLNVLDCLQSPYTHLTELARILKPDGAAVVTTPYDWTVGATPVESWIGGHSQRSETEGSCEATLRSLLRGGGHPNAVEALCLEDETERASWTLRLHDRCRMEYQVHVVVVRKIDKN
jgi:SAM-dependent methyltransferase